MRRLRIYGASDDLIEVEDTSGKGNIGDEFGGGDAPRYIELSTGDVFTVRYDDHGMWRVSQIVVSGKCEVSIDVRPVPAEDEDPEPYTDSAHIVGPVEWVEVWRKWPRPVRDVRERIEEQLHALDNATVERIWDVIISDRDGSRS